MATPEYLATIPDSVVMTPQVFIELMNKFRHHRNVKYGFSAKHTKDIMDYRKKAGSSGGGMTGNTYALPVVWGTEVTYVAN